MRSNVLIYELNVDSHELSVIGKKNSYRRKILIPADATGSEGEIIDYGYFYKEIKEYIINSGLNIKKAFILLNNVEWRFASFPVINKKIIKKLVHGSIRDYFPFANEDYSFSSRLLGLNNGKYQLLLASAPLRPVESYIQLFDKLGITVIGADGYENCAAFYFERRTESDNILVCYENNDCYTYLHIRNKMLQGIRHIFCDEYKMLEISRLIGYYFETSKIDQVIFIGKPDIEAYDYFCNQLNCTCSQEENPDDIKFKILTCYTEERKHLHVQS